MEAATAEREREIAALQADLGGVRSELEHWRNTAAKYEEEIRRLQEAFSQQQQQQNTATQLQGEGAATTCFLRIKTKILLRKQLISFFRLSPS